MSLTFRETRTENAGVCRCMLTLTEVGVTPCQPRYPEKKIDEITKAMRQLIVSAEPHDDESEILTQLKEKFNKTTHLITCLDESLIDHVVFKQCMGFCRQNYA